MTTVKLYLHKGALYYSRNWPPIPPVQISIYKDIFLVNRFNREMDFLMKYPILVTNPELAFEYILNHHGELTEHEFYTLPFDSIIDGTGEYYTCTLKQPK